MVDHQVELLYSSGPGDLYELPRAMEGVDTITGAFSIVAKPGGAPASIGTAYVFDYQADNGNGSMTRPFPNGVMRAGALAVWVNLLADPTSVNAHFIGVDEGGLGGFFAYQKTTGEIALGTVLLSDYLVTSSAYSGWHLLHIRWDSLAQRLILRVYDSSLVLQEEVLGVWTADSAMNTLRVGVFAGNPAAFHWQMANLYVVRGAGVWPPLDPTFEYLAVNAGPGADDNTSLVPGVTQDGMTAGTNDATNEYKLIDEIPASTSDYLRVTASAGTPRIQYYGHAGFGLGSPEFISAGVISKFYQSHTTTHAFQSRLKLGAAVDVSGANQSLRNSIGVAAAPGWGYQYGLFTAKDPNGNDWTPANLDSARPGHVLVNFGAGRESRVAHCGIYAVYGDDSETEHPTGDISGDIIG